jgi:hypothetical protein
MSEIKFTSIQDYMQSWKSANAKGRKTRIGGEEGEEGW